jgi:hypothetical protein
MFDKENLEIDMDLKTELFFLKIKTALSKSFLKQYQKTPQEEGLQPHPGQVGNVCLIFRHHDINFFCLSMTSCPFFSVSLLFINNYTLKKGDDCLY